MLGRGLPKEIDKPRSRSNHRRKLLSPFRIQDKIKELQGKLSKTPFRRHKIEDRPHISPAKATHEQSPFSKKTVRHYEVRSSDRPHSSLFSPARHPLPSKRISYQENHEPQTAKAMKLGRIHSQREETRREEDNLERLRAENQKYKTIYSKSQEKMQQLEHVLHGIRGQHESEKHMLQRTIDGLQKKIQEKKGSLGHLYAYDEKGNNFLIVQDRIIAQTDNENSSSSPEAASKRNSKLPKPTPELSGLSLESK